MFKKKKEFDIKQHFFFPEKGGKLSHLTLFQLYFI